MAQQETIANGFSIEKVTVLMPVGGKATRAREVTKDAMPKHLIELAPGKTVLDFALEGLQKVGFRHFVFALGVHKVQIMDHVKKEAWNRGDATYDFTMEGDALGPDGAVMAAIEKLGIKGQCMIVPGDMLLPWQGLTEMNRQHHDNAADITMAVTSLVTERTTDVGKIVLENESDRIVWVLGRNEEQGMPLEGCRYLTSAAATTISVERYVELGHVYREQNPERTREPLSLRDEIASWIIKNGGFSLEAYDVHGEALDLGTPANIYYGQEHWQDYV